MIPFTESLRYEFPLESRSFVIDVGSYQLNWAEAIVRKYGCRVDAYEPIKRFYSEAGKRMHATAEIEVMKRIRQYNLGVAGAMGGAQEMHVQNDSSGAFATSPETEMVTMIPIAKAVKVAGVRMIDLLKLNCEGAEYDILSSLLTSNDEFGHAIERFRHLMVQFHQCVPNFEEKYNAIAGDLTHTHELQWREPFVWECWKLKTVSP